MKRSGRMRKYPHRYDPLFGSARVCNSDDVTSIVYMIQYGYFNSNVDTYEIRSLLDY